MFVKYYFLKKALFGKDRSWTGKPTPECVHRDEIDFVLVMMVKWMNISRGTTTMHDPEQRKLDSFTLTEPPDCAIVNDWRCMYGVAPV